MDTTFTHTISDTEKGNIPFNTDALPPAVVQMSVDENGSFSLLANRAGYLHLARVCVELGLRKFPNGCHFHKDSAFRFHTGGAGEFTFALIDEQDTAPEVDA